MMPRHIKKKLREDYNSSDINRERRDFSRPRDLVEMEQISRLPAAARSLVEKTINPAIIEEED